MNGRGWSLLRGPDIGLGTSALHVVALTGASLALPVYEVLAAGSDFFVARLSEPVDIVTLGLVLSVGVPCALIGAEALAEAIDTRLRRALHQLLVAVLVALYLLRIANAFAAPPAALTLAAVAAASLGSLELYARFRGVRMLLTLLAPMALALPLLFFFRSPVYELVVPEHPTEFPSVAIDAPPPIVVVVFDELPTLSLLDADGRIDAKRFPGFSRFAATSHWYRLATTPGDVTPLAMAAFHSGREPMRRRPSTYLHLPNNLFTLLGDAYIFNVWESVTEFLPRALEERRPTVPYAERMRSLLLDVGVVALHVVTPHALRGGLPDISDTWGSFLATDADVVSSFGQGRTGWRRRMKGPDRGRVFEAFIDSIHPSSRPTLHYHHSMLPHSPFLHLPSGKLHSRSGDGTKKRRRRRDPDTGRFLPRPGDELVRIHQQHLLQTAYADRLLDRLLDRLEETDLFDPALIVVTADHGRAFTDGFHSRTPDPSTVPEILFVPLLIKLPGQREGRPSDAFASLTDVLPTIADALGAELPWGVNGSSLLREDREPPHESSFMSAKLDSIVTFSYTEALRGLDALRRRNAERFSLEAGDRDLYRFGAFRDALGAPVRSLDATQGHWIVELDQPGALDVVDLDAELLPVSVAGRVFGAEDGARAAIALNGVIQAVVSVYSDEGDARFAGFVRESALRAGANQLEIFEILRDPDGELRLRRTRP